MTLNILSTFSSARLFSPSKLNELRPIAADIDCLSIFQFRTGEIEHLKEELPVFVAKATDVDSSVDILEWWKNASPELPHWFNAAKKVFSIQPSSARVFLHSNKFS